MSDLIEREAVREQINCWIDSGEYRCTNATYYLNKRIGELPSVQPTSGFTRKELEDWLYEICLNNFDNDLRKYTEEIIGRLDGFERYVADMRGAQNEDSD